MLFDSCEWVDSLTLFEVRVVGNRLLFVVDCLVLRIRKAMGGKNPESPRKLLFVKAENAGAQPTVMVTKFSTVLFRFS